MTGGNFCYQRTGQGRGRGTGDSYASWENRQAAMTSIRWQERMGRCAQSRDNGELMVLSTGKEEDRVFVELSPHHLPCRQHLPFVQFSFFFKESSMLRDFPGVAELWWKPNSLNPKEVWRGRQAHHEMAG